MESFTSLTQVVEFLNSALRCDDPVVTVFTGDEELRIVRFERMPAETGFMGPDYPPDTIAKLPERFVVVTAPLCEAESPNLQ